MPEVRCEWSDLLSAECAHCRKLDLDTGSGTDVSHRFEAAFAGSCAHCGRHFAVGDRIGRTRDGQYVCSRCGLR